MDALHETERNVVHHFPALSQMMVVDLLTIFREFRHTRHNILPWPGQNPRIITLFIRVLGIIQEYHWSRNLDMFDERQCRFIEDTLRNIHTEARRIYSNQAFQYTRREAQPVEELNDSAEDDNYTSTDSEQEDENPCE